MMALPIALLLAALGATSTDAQGFGPPSTPAPPSLLWHAIFASGEPALGIDGLADMFRDAHPDIPFLVRKFDDLTNKRDLMTSVRSSVPPDVASFNYNVELKKMQAEGRLANLTDLWEKNGIAAGIPDAVLRACENDAGDKILVPYAGTEVMFMYRKSLWRRAGIRDEELPPRTWDDLVSMLGRIKAAGIPFPLTFASAEDAVIGSSGLKYSNTLVWWIDLLSARTRGSEYLAKLRTGSSNVQDDETLRGSVAKVARLVADGLAVGGSLNDNIGLLFANIGATLFGGTYVLAVLNIINPAIAQDMGVFAFPEITTGLPRDEVVPFRAFGIPELSEHKDTAKQFMESSILKPSAFSTTLGLGVPLVTPILTRHIPTIAAFPLMSSRVEFLQTADNIITSINDAESAMWVHRMSGLVGAAVNVTGLVSAAFGGDSGGDSGGGGPPAGFGGGDGDGDGDGDSDGDSGGPPPGVARSRSLAASQATGSAPPPDVIFAALMENVDAKLAELEETRIAEFLGRTPSPRIDPAPGSYAAPLSVGITAIAGAKIFYTLDGSVPTEFSAEYSGKITLGSAADVTLRYFAQAEGLQPSERLSALFSITSDGTALEDLVVYLAPAGGALLIILGIAALIVRRRLAASRASQWRIDPSEVTVFRDKVLGVGSFGIVYEGEFRGSTVAVKEFYLSSRELSSALGRTQIAAAAAHTGNRSALYATATNPTSKRSNKVWSKGGNAGTVNAWSSDECSTSKILKTPPPTDRDERLDGSGATSLGGTDLATLQTMGGGGRQNAARRLMAGFEGEVSVISQLRHPNTLFLFGAFRSKTKAGLVIERMRSSLHELLHSPTAAVGVKHRVQSAIDAARGMSYLHSHKPPILHRDLKSHNLLVSDRGEVKVADFGLSEITGTGKSSSSIGSAPWTAPEVWNNPKAYNTKCDVYSFGVTLWEIVTSRDPWIGDAMIRTTDDIRGRVLSGERPPLGDAIKPGVPTAIVDLINRCWHADPEARPSMSEIVDRLNEVAQDLPDDEDGGASIGLLDLLVEPAAAKEMVAASRRGDRVVPVEIERATISFADVVGYTDLSAKVGSAVMTTLLTTCFDVFENILAEEGLTKIDTIGDCFIFGGGLTPAERAGAASGDHVVRVTRAAVRILDAVRDIPIDPQDPSLGTVRWRFGVASGPIHATVVGRTNLKVQIVGDSVNTASRMETTSEPGRIQVTSAVREGCEGEKSLDFLPRGSVDVKGKGKMSTFWVTATAPRAGMDSAALA